MKKGYITKVGAVIAIQILLATNCLLAQDVVSKEHLDSACLAPRLAVSSELLQSSMVRFSAPNFQPTKLNRLLPFLYWKIQLYKKFAKKNQTDNPYSLIKKISEEFGINYKERSKKISAGKLSSEDVNHIFTEVLWNERVTKKKLEAILALGQKLRNDHSSLIFNVQLCDASDPGPAEFSTYNSYEVLLESFELARYLSDSDFFSVIEFFKTVIDKKHEMFHAIQMTKKIYYQRDKNIPFRSYTDEALKVLVVMNEERYNRSVELNDLMDTIIEGVNKGRLVAVEVVQKNAPRGINFMLRDLYYKREIRVGMISPAFIIESAV